MSTKFFKLRAPFTSLRAEDRGPHVHISVWEGHANAGTLTVRREVAPDVIRCFFDLDYSEPAVHRYWGGDERGCVVSQRDQTLQDNTILCTPEGTLITWRELQGWDGRGRKETAGQPSDRG